MIQLIIGEKGKGKTKVLLDKANTEIKSVNGSVVYLDKSTQHMYELNNKIRLIDVTGYPVSYHCRVIITVSLGKVSRERSQDDRTGIAPCPVLM